MEQSGRLGMIGIELNQGIGRLKSIFAELAAGEKTPIQIPGENSLRRDFSSPPANSCMNVHTFSSNELATERLMLAAGVISRIDF